MAGQAKDARENQKRRTRADLLRAARSLVARGATPTVPEVADAAGISRATAYRYFSTGEQMLREAVLDAMADQSIDLAVPGTGSSTPEHRLDALVARVFGLVVANEALFRAFLAGTLAGSDRQPRGARRLRWLAEVLEPVRAGLPEGDAQRLVHALALVTGIEPLIVLRDVCGLDAEEAERVARWVAQALLAATLREAPNARLPVAGDGPSGG